MKQYRIHPCWRMIFACTLMISAVSLLSTGMSINLAALRSIAGLSGTQSSMVLTVRGIVSFLAMLFAGVFYRKLGLRLGMSASLMLAAVAFLFFAAGNGRPVIYYMAGAVGGIAYAYGMMLPASMLLKNWFNKSRGFAFSIASAGTALTSLIGAPILQRMINGFGLYTTFLAEAGFLLLVAVLIFCIVREKPETMGLKPYGGDTFIPDRGIKTKDVPTIPLNRGWIYAVFVAALLLNFGASPASAHLSLNFTTVGLDSMSAAKAISLYGAGLLFFKLIYGKTVDRVGSCISTVIFGLLVALGYAMCGAAVWFPNNAWMFTSLLILSSGIPIHTLGYPVWALDMVSDADYAKTLKLFQTAYQLAGVIGAPIPGILADLTGNYSLFFLIYAFACVISIIIVVLAYGALRKKQLAVKNE